MLTLPEAPAHYARRHCQKQTHDLEKSIDQRWLKKAQDAILHNKPVEILDEIKNTNRTAGAILSNAIAVRHGHAGLSPGLLRIRLRGVGGQSFGAFISRGMTMTLEERPTTIWARDFPAAFGRLSAADKTQRCGQCYRR